MLTPRNLATLLLAWLLAACSLPTANSTPPLVSSTPSAFPPVAATHTPSASPTSEHTNTPAITPTPAPEPASFTSSLLRAWVQPANYIADQCEYLAKRWDPQGSLPGTIVAPIMYHSILRGNAVPSLSQDINEVTFYRIVEVARELGYEAITSQQLVGFLHNNAAIPPRSMLLILDDRRAGTAQEYFLPLYEEYGWRTVLGWIIGDTDQRTGENSSESLWDWIERLNDTGAFDVQSHALNHIPIVGGESADFLRRELGDNIPILEQHFGQRPVAHIWAGGNFSAGGVAMLDELGYQIGFTVYSRGPIAFNWVPQGEEERAIGNPLLLLPRFWDSAAELNLHQAAEIGDAAQQFARANHAAEAAWFVQNCGGELPPLDAVFEE